MRTTLALICAWFAILALPAEADAATGFETDGIVLYQPDDVLGARLGAVGELAEHVRGLQMVCAEFFATTEKAENLTLVVAIRPGKRSKVWFISSDAAAAADAGRETLRKKLEEVTPCEVKGGPVAIALLGKIAGGLGETRKGDPNFTPPIPKEWSEAKLAESPGPVPECYLDVVWPEKAGK